jgi:hypothetical protein
LEAEDCYAVLKGHAYEPFMQLVGPVVIRCQAFSAGTLVRIQGLQSAPELNGREAKIVNFDEADMWPFAALVLCCIMLEASRC